MSKDAHVLRLRDLAYYINPIFILHSEESLSNATQFGV